MLLSACSFSARAGEEQPNNNADADIDSYMVDAYVPDAPSMCPSVTPATCVPNSNILRECKTIGQPAIDTTCSWGCLTNSTPHHCGKIVPSGGAVMTVDLDPNSSLQDKTISVNNNNIVINSDTGSISNNIRGTGMGISNGIDFQVRNGVGIFRFNKLTINTNDGSRLRVIGTNAVALVSITTIDVDRAAIDVRGDCLNGNAGPGGRTGGATGTAGMPMTGGGGPGPSLNGNDSGGGGGGGYGANGGKGGIRSGDTAATGGSPIANQKITTLFGGSGGGGGGGPLGGYGGGGGGAIQIVSNGQTKFTGLIGFIVAGINAGGCGGKAGGSGDAGGGGGSGGAILIEASSLKFDFAGASVNGGGGGGADNPTSTGPGQAGQLNTNRASGGAGANGAGNGAGGGTSGGHAGLDGATNDNAGGGGGGVGWIRMNTVSGGVSMQNFAFVSPSFNDGNTTSTRGMPTIQ